MVSDHAQQKKSWGKEGVGREVQSDGYFHKKPLHAVSLVFLEVAEHLLANGK